MAEFETTRDANGNTVVVERRRGGGGIGIIIALVIIAALVWAAFHFGLIGVSDKGSLPTVNVTADGGKAPELTTGSIDVGSKTTTVETPTVTTKETTVEVPTVSVNKAEDAK
jgi:preprotein translocase subunit SecY